MLHLLRINNFALIDRLELEFGNGLNVLTGETGAGKSIILDAIDVVLGGKVNSRMIRTGSVRATIEATFEVEQPLIEWLKEQEIELLDETSMVFSREISYKTSLRSRLRINGVLVNRQLMAQIRDRLVEITAQGQTVQLMIPEMQRQLLDLYGGTSLQYQRHLVATAYETHQAAQRALEKRRKSEQERLQRLDLLSYQINELESAALQDAEELEQLEQERDRLSHVVELQQLSYEVYQVLYQSNTDSGAAADLLAQSESTLTDMVKYDSQLEPMLDMVRAALTQVVEAGHQINAYGDGLETDPERLVEVEERIRTLKQICRKYGPSLGEAIAYYQTLQEELAELTDSGLSLEELEKEYQATVEHLTTLCGELTGLRKQAAVKLEKQLVTQLKPLAMDKVIFQCRITPTNATATGSDRVVYYFSPNPGEPLQPLSDTASGGEMSRFLLALKACFSNSEQGAGTLIFDEIDAGVSGRVAQAIAAKLNQLSQQHQVLCVTHQPLIAAMADSHFRVDKETIASLEPSNGSLDPESPDLRTVVRVTTLDNRRGRREELAQLTGGDSATDAIAFAESILSQADARRKGKL